MTSRSTTNDGARDAESALISFLYGSMPMQSIAAGKARLIEALSYGFEVHVSVTSTAKHPENRSILDQHSTKTMCGNQSATRNAEVIKLRVTHS